jgi:hypothetical protein
MKMLAWAAAFVIVLAAVAAVGWLAARGQRGVQCPDQVVIVRGRGGTPMECVCIDGALSTCFTPGP